MVVRPAVNALYKALCDVVPEVGFVGPHDRALLLKDHTYAAVDELARAGLTAPRIVNILVALAWAAGLDEKHPAVIDDLTAWCNQRCYDAPARGHAMTRNH
jgi:hypothetical protein